ncbi:MAG: cytochrome c biogenesis protein CcdA [Pseudolabrys sp.]|jgi:cytochrome c-type biogenesis protein
MELAQDLASVLTLGNVTALPLAFAGGLLAGMNPCCLALYPAAASCCSPAQIQEVQHRPLGNAVAFILGIAVAIAVLGSLAAYIGHVTMLAEPFRYAIAFIPIVMGADRLGWIHLPALTPKFRSAGMTGAFGTGLSLSLILGPCGTPVLASVLTFAAYKQSIAFGALLLFAYGIGNGLPLLLVGTASSTFLKRIQGSRLGAWIDPAIGAFLIALGLYLLWLA